MEQGVYDPGGSMLRDFLDGLTAHLEPGGEGWLILSDLAVVDRTDIRPRHPRAGDTADPLHAARAAEVTSLWRLAGT
ncbi:hypothetical protein [Streptomyces sp. NBC_00046]|uniref:hypothetical protein n=1 Tax=unclassified Streptomyces TaxID=2593676 RepID=UPI00387077BE